MEDKRKFKRHPIYYLKVIERNTGEIIGHLADISVGGIMLVSNGPVETNKDWEFKIKVPEEVVGRTEIDFEAKSIWCAQDADPDFYNTGFQFLKISPEQLELIDFLIDDCYWATAFC
ncbi:PilZ domain-containing protein [Candidatus Magnetomoraceae bacterium gMMP-15]